MCNFTATYIIIYLMGLQDLLIIIIGSAALFFLIYMLIKKNKNNNCTKCDIANNDSK